MFWLAVFGIGGRTDGFHDLAITLYREVENLKILAGIATALPIGVLIHQFSVLIKNWLTGKLFKELSDYPYPENIVQLSCENKPDTHKYCLDKISNLNSFYYVRFDNGLLAPFFAWLVVGVLIGLEVKLYLLLTAALIAFVTLIYLPRIYCEMKFYRNVLGGTNNIPPQEYF